MFNTELAYLDNLQLIVQKGQIWGATIANYSMYDKRKLDLLFGVNYGTDISFVEALISNSFGGCSSSR